MSKDTSAPAFPIQIKTTSDCVGLLGEDLKAGHNVTYPGMTMRQYFAAHAPITLVDATKACQMIGINNPTGRDVLEMISTLRVGYADALLAELEK